MQMVDNSCCRICEQPTVHERAQQLRDDRPPGRTLDFYTCTKCGFAWIPGNAGGFETAETFLPGSLPTGHHGTRVGDGVYRGREYYMFLNCAKILKRKKLRVLFFGGGLSRDFEVARDDPRVSEVRITDVANFMDVDAFIPLDDDSKFDIVVASEVVEHFTRPVDYFETLLGFVADKGMLVISTNMQTGRRRYSLQVYPFILGHVAYWSPAALYEIAKRFGFELDLRLPQCATVPRIGPRKRYGFFYKGGANRRRLVEWFGKYPYALSEDAHDWL